MVVFKYVEESQKTIGPALAGPPNAADPPLPYLRHGEYRQPLRSSA